MFSFEFITRASPECVQSHDLFKSPEKMKAQLAALCIVNIARFTSFRKEDVATEMYNISSFDLNKWAI